MLWLGIACTPAGRQLLPALPAGCGLGQRDDAAWVSAAWTKAATETELADAGGKKVVELSVGRVLLADVSGEVFAVSNKCSHLGLPLVGKTAMFQAEISDKCVVCPAHGTAFDLTSGEVKGEWCPKLPNLPIVGKGPKEKPLPTYECRTTDDGIIEVNI